VYVAVSSRQAVARSRDPDKLIREFVNGYHGKAAEPVRAYIDRIQREGAKREVSARCPRRIAACRGKT